MIHHLRTIGWRYFAKHFGALLIMLGTVYALFLIAWGYGL